MAETIIVGSPGNGFFIDSQSSSGFDVNPTDLDVEFMSRMEAAVADVAAAVTLEVQTLDRIEAVVADVASVNLEG
jgi:hypothetical protein